MYLRDVLVKLGREENDPCLTISLNTHRTHPDSDKDKIVLKNLIEEAEKDIIARYGKRKPAVILDKLATLAERYDYRHSLDSLHIFISGDTEEIVRIPWTTHSERITIGNKFDIRSLLKAFNRTEEYLVMLLSQGGVKLYKALNDSVVSEIRNEDFPFAETPYYVPNNSLKSNAKLVDDLILEYFNQIDKALIKVYRQTELRCVVICTEENFSRLLQIADIPELYIGYASVNYNKTKDNQIVKQSWEIVENLQKLRRIAAIIDANEAVGKGLIKTDLNDIYTAAKEGRGDLLIAYEDYIQPVRILDDKLVDSNEDDTASDAVNIIAWEVISRGGNAFFTCLDEINGLGEIVLKTRY